MGQEINADRGLCLLLFFWGDCQYILQKIPALACTVAGAGKISDLTNNYVDFVEIYIVLLKYDYFRNLIINLSINNNNIYNTTNIIKSMNNSIFDKFPMNIYLIMMQR